VNQNRTADDQETCLADACEVPDIDALLCSAQTQIGLKPEFCAIEKRPERLDWLHKKLSQNLLWVIRDASELAGMMILEQDDFERINGIAYIVVAERMRGRGNIGPRLIHKAKTVAVSLRAEARNDHSRRLLENCGFREQEERSPSGHPILNWSERKAIGTTDHNDEEICTALKCIS
jgi:ribosomal protein S18 acetylase RimI-like enzyme